MGKSKELAELGQVVTQDGGNVLVGTTTNPDSRKFRVYGLTEFDGAGVSLITHKSSGTEIGSAGQGNYVVSGGPADGYGITSATSLVFGSGGTTERMRIDASGRVTMPYQPCFMAQYTNNPNVTSGWKTYNLGIGVASHARWNVGGHYSTSTGRFTAPVTGYYQFDMSLCAVYPAPQTNYLSVELWVNGGRYAFTGWNNKASGYYKEAETFVIPLNAGDYVEAGYESAQSFQALGGTGGWYTYFSGHLIG